MSRKRILNVIIKEWRVLATDASSFLMITLLPFMILAEPFVVARVASAAGGKAILANPFFQGALNNLIVSNPAAANLSELDQVSLMLVTQLNLFLLLIPTMIAVYTAAYSIVDEKTSHSLEPLLATPVRTSELLLGKALAGAIPAAIMTWVCAAVYLLAMMLFGWARLIPYLVTASWFLNFLLVAPLIALLSFLLGVIGSSKAKDYRNAQNYVLLIIFPIFALIAAQVSGIVWFNTLATFFLAVIIAIIDLLVLRLAVRLFQRETIVVQWK